MFQEEPLDSCTIYQVVMLIYGLTRSITTIAQLHVIGPCKRYTLRQIPTHTHVRNTIQGYDTPRTRAETKIADADYHYSRTRLRL